MGSLALNEVRLFDGGVALIVRGVVDDDTVEYFERSLESAIGIGSRQLIIDLTACQLASAGLAALMRLQRRSRRPAATRLVATGVEALRTLQLVGLTSRFRIHATLDAALHSCGSAARPLAWVTGIEARPSTQRGPRGGAEVRHLTSIEGFGSAGFSRRIERGRRAVAHGSRTAVDAGNE